MDGRAARVKCQIRRLTYRTGLCILSRMDTKTAATVTTHRTHSITLTLADIIAMLPKRYRSLIAADQSNLGTAWLDAAPNADGEVKFASLTLTITETQEARK